MAKTREILTKRIKALKVNEAQAKALLAQVLRSPNELEAQHELDVEGAGLHLATVRGTKAGLRLRAKEERRRARKARNARKRRLRVRR